MIEFQLFRIKVFPSRQLNMFDEQRTRSEILLQTIEALPSSELRSGSIWSIGNLRRIDEDGLYFRVGRTAKSKIEIKDGSNFIDQDFESAPYTHIVLDIQYGVVAIAKKAKLSPNTVIIAKQLAKLLSVSERAVDFRAEFQIDVIPDPEQFLEYIETAESILKFSMTLSRPNPFDVDEFFQKPMQRLLEETRANKGKAEVEGRNLDSSRLSDLARSAAATGENAVIIFKPTIDSPKERKELRGNNVNIAQDTIESEDDLILIIQRLRIKYAQIRGKLPPTEEV